MRKGGNHGKAEEEKCLSFLLPITPRARARASIDNIQCSQETTGDEPGPVAQAITNLPKVRYYLRNDGGEKPPKIWNRKTERIIKMSTTDHNTGVFSVTSSTFTISSNCSKILEMPKNFASSRTPVYK